MKNGQLKPGNNVQMGTEGQFIIGYSLHQRTGDTRCFIQNLEHIKQYISLPSNIIADSRYGREENYAYFEE
ncbi:transposase IS4 family protein [Bacillus methanolicus PB1]|uniref:Transposase IS4 family protein n=1 Tax=Bacillus methanolicus PB1 TaxID=997296 RepID=I3E4A4_BACMT|nr:IS1182 family transposase [Bacillus methanolicus]EIJ81325.1 transposase IS4 family protein [Bacillus methanolicus PB1]